MLKRLFGQKAQLEIQQEDEITASSEFKKLMEENKKISGGDKKLEEHLNKQDYNKLKEKKERDQEINSHTNEWGKEMCQWMVENEIDHPRTKEIMEKLTEWGEKTCKSLLTHKLSIGNTVEMVALSLGQPTDIDQKELTDKTNKFRYVYGVPRQGAVYIWFKDEKVTKIKVP